MKCSIRNIVAIALAASVLAIGSASAQSPGPTGPCPVNGEILPVDQGWGQRFYICNNNEWRFFYECQYDASGYCIIL